MQTQHDNTHALLYALRCASERGGALRCTALFVTLALEFNIV